MLQSLCQVVLLVVICDCKVSVGHGVLVILSCRRLPMSGPVFILLLVIEKISKVVVGERSGRHMVNRSLEN